ncbi:hypothetical protein FGO68_gene11871 [Halteria grandinella]|uniref:Uncharacterized protein n=1 Tax=Halteria grandinella TaxID=5974 RepID=A0A8J8P3Z2_HALGN|nr:hypothetical protein FGO68_gene11871 [Halteria grandinella]
MNTNILSNLFLSQTLQFLWGLINSLQMIVRLPLLNLSFPANLQLILGIIIDVTNLSFFSTRDYEQEAFGFTQSEPFDQNFNTMGYDTMNLIYNMGLMFWYLPMILMAFLVLRVVKKMLQSTELQESVKIIVVQWKEGLLVFCQQNILQSAIKVHLGELHRDHHLRPLAHKSGNFFYSISLCQKVWITMGDRVLNVLAIMLAFSLMVFPFISIAWLVIKRKDLEKHEAQCGSLYSGLRIKKSFFALMYSPIFLIRRQIFAATIIFLHDNPMAQVNVTFYTSLLMISYLVHAQPFEEPQLNYLEIFNEITFLMLTYPVLLFTGYMDADAEFQYNIGWSMILTIILNVVVNFIVILWEALKGAWTGIKKCRQRISQNIAQSDKVEKLPINNYEELQQPIDEIAELKKQKKKTHKKTISQVNAKSKRSSSKYNPKPKQRSRLASNATDFGAPIINDTSQFESTQTYLQPAPQIRPRIRNLATYVTNVGDGEPRFEDSPLSMKRKSQLRAFEDQSTTVGGGMSEYQRKRELFNEEIQRLERDQEVKRLYDKEMGKGAIVMKGKSRGANSVNLL